MTGMPLLAARLRERLHVLDDVLLLRVFGRAGSAKAPPSMITSFCRSWMIITQRDGVQGQPFVVHAAPPSPCTARAAGRRCVRIAYSGGRARDVDRVPVLAAPGEVSGVLGDEDRAEVLACGRDHPDPARTGHPDVPALVALHPVRDALLDHAGADALEEHAAVRDRPVGRGVVHLDVRPRRVVDVEQRLVRGEADAVRHLELVATDDELRIAAARRDAVHALEAEPPLARLPEAWACARTTGRRSRSRRSSGRTRRSGCSAPRPRTPAR